MAGTYRDFGKCIFFSWSSSFFAQAFFPLSCYLTPVSIVISSLAFPPTPMLPLFIMSLPRLTWSLRPLFAIVFGVLVFPFCGIPPEPTDQKSYSLGLARACRQTSTNTISFHNGPFHIVKEFTVCVHERVCLRVRVHSCTCAYTDVGACACSQCLAVCRDVNFSSSQLQSKCFHDHTATFAAPTYETAICSPAHHSDKHSCIFPFAFEFVYFILFQVGLLMYPRLTP